MVIVNDSIVDVDIVEEVFDNDYQRKILSLYIMIKSQFNKVLLQCGMMSNIKFLILQFFIVIVSVSMIKDN